MFSQRSKRFWRQGTWFLLALVGLSLAGCPAKTRFQPTSSMKLRPGTPGKQVQVLELQNAKQRHHIKTRVQTRSSNAYAHYMRGRLHAIEQRHKQAIQEFKRAVVHDEQSAFLYYCIAEQFFRLKQMKNALFWAKKTLEKDAKYGPAHHLLGQIHWKQKNSKRSVASFRKALTFSPRFFQAYIDLDNTLRTLRRPWQERVTVLQQMLRQLPSHYEGYLRIGQLYESSAQTELAIAHYKKALNRNPAHVTVLFLLGRIYQRRREWKRAVEMFQVLLSYQPDEWSTRIRLGAVFLERKEPDDRKLAAYHLSYVEREATRYSHATRLYIIGKELYQNDRFQEAVSWLRRAVKKKTNFAAARYALGLALRKQKQLAKALAQFRQVPLKKTALFLEARAQMLEILVSQKRIKKARQLLKQTRKHFSARPNVWIKLSQAFVEEAPSREVDEEWRFFRTLREKWPKHDGLLYHEAYLRFKQKKQASCEALLQLLLQRNAKHALSLNFLGYLYAEKNKRLQEAKLLIERALQLEPANVYYMDSLGWVLYRLGDIPKARRILEYVHSRLPKEVSVLVHLAYTYQEGKQHRKALQLFQRVLQLNPEPRYQKEAQAQVEKLKRELPRETTSRPRWPQVRQLARQQCRVARIRKSSCNRSQRLSQKPPTQGDL